MTFAIVYIEHGDLVEDFDDHDAATSALAEFVEQHPEIEHRVGILAFDDDGMPSGDFEPAAVLLGHRAGATA